jgi:hypothetical protein
MTVEDVLRQFPGEATTIATGRRSRVGGMIAQAAIPSVAVGDHRYGLDFLFDAGRLAAVQLRLLGGDDARAAERELESWLSRQHGPPAVRQERALDGGAWNASMAWTARGSAIELEGWVAAADSRILRLDLRDGQIRPATESALLVTFRRRALQ